MQESTNPDKAMNIYCFDQKSIAHQYTATSDLLRLNASYTIAPHGGFNIR